MMWLLSRIGVSWVYPSISLWTLRSIAADATREINNHVLFVGATYNYGRIQVR